MNMQQLLKVRQKAGEIGIEIELEGMVLPMDGMPHWGAEHDGSLRGNAVELVLLRPCARGEVRRCLEEVSTRADDLGSDILDTGRAGVHVHVNIQKLTENQLVNFITLYLIYENILVEWCGESRTGNLFCLRSCDASGFLENLIEAIRTSEWDHINTDEVRYASMNLKAIRTYGSLEFRAMRSTIDVDVLEQWVTLLLCLKDSAARYANPIEIIEEFSVEGVEAAFNKTFGKHAALLPFHPPALMQGIRVAQIVAYSKVDWEGEVKKPEPLPVLDENVAALDDLKDEHEARGDIYFMHQGKHYYRFTNHNRTHWATAEDIVHVCGGGDDVFFAVVEERDYLYDHYLDHACRMLDLDPHNFMEENPR